MYWYPMYSYMRLGMAAEHMYAMTLAASSIVPNVEDRETVDCYSYMPSSPSIPVLP